jgi:hypothetical protein
MGERVNVVFRSAKERPFADNVMQSLAHLLEG